MQSSESEAQEPGPKAALWGGTPQYDYVCFEKCTRLGIPVEAGRQAGATGDDLRCPENSLSHPQVGLDNGTLVAAQASPGSRRLWGSRSGAGRAHIPVHPRSHQLSPPLADSTSGFDIRGCTYTKGPTRNSRQRLLSPAMDATRLGTGEINQSISALVSAKRSRSCLQLHSDIK